jgi:hypothetical protein
MPWSWHALAWAAYALAVASLGCHGITLTTHAFALAAYALAVASLGSHGITLAAHAMAWAAHGIALAAHALAVASLGSTCLGFGCPCLGHGKPWQPWHCLGSTCLSMGSPYLGSHGIALATHALAVACFSSTCLGMGSPCLGRGKPWQAWHCLGMRCPYQGNAMPWLWHAMAAHALALALPWQGFPTKNNPKSRKEASLAAQGSWQHAMLHAACPKRAFSPSRKIGLCHFRF